MGGRLGGVPVLDGRDPGHAGRIRTKVRLLAGGGGILANLGWPLGILPVLFLLPLLFPDGRLPSPRWRPLLWTILVSLALITVTVVFGEERLTGNSDEIWVSNPLYLPAVDAALGWFGDFWLMFLILFAGSVVSLAVRFRGAQGVERQQIKWVAFSMLVLLATFFVSEFLFIPNDAVLLDAIVTGGAFLLLPIAIGVAVLRYRLYDLDVVVRKAVVYALLAVFATLVYLAIVVGVGAWLGRDSSFLTMLAAVIVAVTFQPVRARVTRFANRLVYGKRASPYEVLAEFSERVGGAYADEDVLPRMARVLGEGIGAERADVWLAVDRRAPRRGGVARRCAPVVPRCRSPNGSVPPIEGMDRVYPVEQAGELLGALAVRKPTSDPVTPADEKLIADLAVASRARPAERAPVRGAQGAAGRAQGGAETTGRRRRTPNGAGSNGTSTTEPSNSSSRSPSSSSSRTGSSNATRRRRASWSDSSRARRTPPSRTCATWLAASTRRCWPTRDWPPRIEAQAREVARSRSRSVPTASVATRRTSRRRCTSRCWRRSRTSRSTPRRPPSRCRSRSGTLELVFAVTDDGRGFDPTTNGGGSGLQGIADRLGRARRPARR